MLVKKLAGLVMCALIIFLFIMDDSILLQEYAGYDFCDTIKEWYAAELTSLLFKGFFPWNILL